MGRRQVPRARGNPQSRRCGMTEFSLNATSTTGPVFTYSPADNTLTVDPVVRLGATGFDTVVSSIAGSHLSNFGNIISFDEVAAHLAGSGAVIVNDAGGSIVGGISAIVAGGNASVTNAGNILGFAEAGVAFSAAGSVLNNSGYIFGLFYAVKMVGGDSIDNH